MAAHNALYEMMAAGREWILPDPGDGEILKVPHWGIFSLVSAAAETRVPGTPLAPGNLMGLFLMTDGGDITVTFTPDFDGGGNNVLTFAEAGDFALLMSIKTAANTFEWKLIAPSTVAVS